MIVLPGPALREFLPGRVDYYYRYTVCNHLKYPSLLLDPGNLTKLYCDKNGYCMYLGKVGGC